LPQKAQAVCGLTATPHFGHLFKVVLVKAKWARFLPTALLVRLFFGLAIKLGLNLFYLFIIKAVDSAYHISQNSQENSQF